MSADDVGDGLGFQFGHVACQSRAVRLVQTLMRQFITCIALGLSTGFAVQETTRLDLANLEAVAEQFGTTVGTFVVQDLGTGKILLHDSIRAAERMSPFSTFKIANALTALDSGVATDATYAIAYDSQRNPAQE